MRVAVANLDRAEQFYCEVLGFRVRRRDGRELVLAAGDAALVSLEELKEAVPKPPRSTGLYHFAVLVPDRQALSRSLRRLVERRYPLTGASDHLVSEALYLSDPDGNGIEIYRDRPRSEWPLRGSQVQMATDPLDLRGLLADDDGRPWQGLDPATRIGHVHLHVAHLQPSEAFYCDILGFDLMQHYPGAAFVSAGGYHHHLGLNVWNGVGAPPPPPDAVGLRWFEIVVPGAEALQRVRERLEGAGVRVEPDAGGLLLRDPSSNGIRLTAVEG